MDTIRLQYRGGYKKYDAKEMAKIVSAVVDPTKRWILEILMDGSKYVGEINKELLKKYDVSITEQGLRTRHIRPLLELGVITPKDGHVTIRGGRRPVTLYELNPIGLERVLKKFDAYVEGLLETSKVVQKDILEPSALKATPKLRVMSGEKEGMALPIKKERTKIGRIGSMKSVQKNDLVLPNSYGYVTRISKPHAKVVFKDGEYYLVDCGSTSGTFLKGKKLIKNREYKLNPGDIFRIADTDIIFE
jgi:DNA-binding transcriptional ArsR family regulator